MALISRRVAAAACALRAEPLVCLRAALPESEWLLLPLLSKLPRNLSCFRLAVDVLSFFERNLLTVVHGDDRRPIRR